MKKLKCRSPQPRTIFCLSLCHPQHRQGCSETAPKRTKFPHLWQEHGRCSNAPKPWEQTGSSCRINEILKPLIGVIAPDGPGVQWRVMWEGCPHWEISTADSAREGWSPIHLYVRAGSWRTHHPGFSLLSQEWCRIKRKP